MTRRPLINIRPWSDTDDEALRKLVAHGVRTSAIAKKLKRHETTITRRINLLKNVDEEKPIMNDNLPQWEEVPEQTGAWHVQRSRDGKFYRHRPRLIGAEGEQAGQSEWTGGKPE